MSAPRPQILLAFHWYSEALHEGALKYCVEHGWDAKVLTVENAEALGRTPYDGILGMLPLSPDHPIRRVVAETTKPVVELSPAYPENTGWGRCPSDGEATGKLAADYLHRRPVASFAFVSTGPWPAHDARWAGFKKGLAGDARRCVRYDTGRLDAASQKPLGEFLLSLPRPVGVFASVDESARHALEAARDAGLAVPGDVFILGYGNRELISRVSPVPISTVSVDYAAWGYAAAGLLDDMMSGRAAPGTVRPFAPGAIIERASTGGESGGDPLCAKALALMNENVAQPLTVAQLARRLGISKVTLERAFATAFGEGVAHRYLVIRMETAKAMLAAGEKSEAAASAAGFVSYSAFGKAFQKIIGVTPGNFARQHARGSERKTRPH